MYHYPFYYPGMVEHSIALSSVQNFQANINNAQGHTPPTMIPQYNAYPQCHGVPMMSSFQFNPGGMIMHSNHLPTQNMWSSGSSTPVPEETCSRPERRAKALAKFIVLYKIQHTLGISCTKRIAGLIVALSITRTSCTLLI